MNAYRKIARATAVLSAAALLGAATAAAQPLDAADDGNPALSARSEAPSAQHGLAGTGSEADPFTACRTAGAPMSSERFLCYRAAANLANERFTRGSTSPAPVTRPIVIEGPGFDWTDAGIGFAAAVGLGLLGAGSAVALRSRRVRTSSD
jgi:hypothetical protein